MTGEGAAAGSNARHPVLVTGGAGFIGANLVRLLLERGYPVTVLDNLTAGRRRYVSNLPVKLVEGDILDSELLARLVPGHGRVVHLAAQTGVPASLADPRRDCEVNVVGTLNLLEAARCSGQSVRFVFASSNAPLGRQQPPATEDKAPLPISPYGASKLAGEAYCLAYHGSWGLGTVALRFGNAYGPFSAHKNSVVAKFFKGVLETNRITIEGGGQQTRDFIHADDLCRAIVLALESEVGGEVFQIATGVETSIAQLAAAVERIVGSKPATEHAPGRQGDIQRNYSLIAKARQALGWQPEVDLATGLAETFRWFLAQPASLGGRTQATPESHP